MEENQGKTNDFGTVESVNSQGEQVTFVAGEPRSDSVEAVCQRCGGPNVVWFAPNELWNRVDPKEGILCPVCFVRSAEAAGIRPTGWCLTAEDLDLEAENARLRANDSAFRDGAERMGKALNAACESEEILQAENARLRAALTEIVSDNPVPCSNTRHFARDVLRAWPELNRERGLLIDKSIAGTLEPHESRRLEELQAFADWHVELMAPRPEVPGTGGQQ